MGRASEAAAVAVFSPVSNLDSAHGIRDWPVQDTHFRTRIYLEDSFIAHFAWFSATSVERYWLSLVPGSRPPAVTEPGCGRLNNSRATSSTPWLTATTTNGPAQNTRCSTPYSPLSRSHSSGGGGKIARHQFRRGRPPRKRCAITSTRRAAAIARRLSRRFRNDNAILP